MDIPQLQADLAAKADEAWLGGIRRPWSDGVESGSRLRQVLRKGHRCSSVFDGEVNCKGWSKV